MREIMRIVVFLMFLAGVILILHSLDKIPDWMIGNEMVKMTSPINASGIIGGVLLFLACTFFFLYLMIEMIILRESLYCTVWLVINTLLSNLFLLLAVSCFFKSVFLVEQIAQAYHCEINVFNALVDSYSGFGTFPIWYLYLTAIFLFWIVRRMNLPLLEFFQKY